MPPLECNPMAKNLFKETKNRTLKANDRNQKRYKTKKATINDYDSVSDNITNTVKHVSIQNSALFDNRSLLTHAWSALQRCKDVQLKQKLSVVS